MGQLLVCLRSTRDRLSSRQPIDEGPSDIGVHYRRSEEGNKALKVHVAQQQNPVSEKQHKDKQRMTKSIVCTDNRTTEKLTERCRPSTVARSYDTLESQQWLHAKETVEMERGSDLKEDKIVGILCDSLMSTYKACKQLYTSVEIVISELMRRPTMATKVVRSGLIPSCQPAPLSDDLADLVKQKLRQATDSVDTDINCLSDSGAGRQPCIDVEIVVSELMRRPTLATEVVRSGLIPSCQPAPLSDDLTDLVKQKLRQATDSVDTDIICLMATDFQKPDTRSLLQMMSSSKSVSGYIRESASITWQMVVQNPPMKLVADDRKFDDVKHRLWWSCDRPRKKRINEFVWPVLYDYENGNVMVKGCVIAS